MTFSPDINSDLPYYLREPSPEEQAEREAEELREHVLEQMERRISSALDDAALIAQRAGLRLATWSRRDEPMHPIDRRALWVREILQGLDLPEWVRND